MTLNRRRLGRTNIQVTELGFGGATIGGIGQCVSEAQARATLEAAWDAGLRYFDTAPWYGRGLSEHRLPKRLARSEQTPPVRERSRSPSPMGASAPIRKESPSGSESHSADDIPTPMPVFRKVTLNQGARQNSENRLAGRQLSDRRLPRQMAKTADAPPRARDEHSSPPMGTSALDAPRHDLDPPEQWRKDWRRQVETIVQSRWCSKALLMIDLSKATLPDPRSFLNTRGLMRVAFKHKLTVAEAASIYLYTSALY